MRTFLICALLVALRFLPDVVFAATSTAVAASHDPQRVGPPRWLGTPTAVVILR